MYLVFGTVRIDPADRDSLKEAMQAMILASREEEGCINYSYSFDALDPALMHISEQWQSKEALALHFQTPHMAAWRQAIASVRTQDLSLQTMEGQAESMAL